LSSMLMRFYVMWLKYMQVTFCWRDYGNSIGRQRMMELEIGILL
jgi:hypothetical protein